MDILKPLFQLIIRNELVIIAIGLILGGSVVLLIRARQSWIYRQVFGYSTYKAKQIQRRLIWWAFGGLMLALAAGFLWLTADVNSSSIAENQIPEASIEASYARLIIPRLAVSVEIIEAPIVARRWDISRLTDEVAHLEQTAYPGDGGNAVLAGHITTRDERPGPFFDLDQLKRGDYIFIERNGTTYTYEVSDMMMVAPTELQIAYPTEDSRLTLITCSGWEEELETYNERFVIIAQLIP